MSSTRLVTEFRPVDDLEPGMVVVSSAGEPAMVRGIGPSFDGHTRTIRLELPTGRTEHVVLHRDVDVETRWAQRKDRATPSALAEDEWRTPPGSTHPARTC